MRNYENEHSDNESRRYMYDFDHIMRRYMIRALLPFFNGGKALELGCFEGAMTRLIADHFTDLTVIEAAGSLIETARAKVPESVRFVHSTIETAELESVYGSIFLVHTLEHLDDPVATLARIGSWLSPTGRLFVVVPNADAASRQIAVKMGLVNTNNAVTPGELEHGHRRTYSLDTLEYDMRRAGLRVESRGGIFFKPFANFQFDLLLKNEVIDEGYLEGCYGLGMHYPELTASIFTVCAREDSRQVSPEAL